LNKQKLINSIDGLSESITMLSREGSLATLDHKINQRQALIETLFEQYSESLLDHDIEKLKAILDESSQLIETMQLAKLNRGDEIIKHKNKGNRIRLYTSIAKQK